MIEILQGDNLPILRTMADASFDLIYIDPPFNTGKPRTHTTLQTVRDDDGDRPGNQQGGGGARIGARHRAARSLARRQRRGGTGG